MAYERLNLKTGQVITEEVFAHLEDGIEGAANAVLMTPILYADLVALRDARKLKAGMFYRITDYVTTTIQENTQSAGHAFDVIVMATDSQTLSEEARAIVHEGDTYFTKAGANLAAWKVWYALDNDSARFAWAAPADGVLVKVALSKFGYSDYTAYRVPEKDYELDGKKYYAWNQGGGPGQTGYSDTVDITSESPVYGSSGEIDSSSSFLVDRQEVEKAKGVIYRLIDEWGNDVPYDFKNIKFKHPADPETYPNYYYTFCNIVGADGASDKSLERGKCWCNVMRPYIYSARILNANVFVGAFSDGLHSNTFGDNCYSNVFGDNCYSNTFGDNCYSNTFGDNCYSNTFGDNCYGNVLSSGCHQDTFLSNVKGVSLFSGVSFYEVDVSNVFVGPSTSGSTSKINIFD